MGQAFSGLQHIYVSTYRFLRTLNVVGWMQFVDQVVLP